MQLEILEEKLCLCEYTMNGSMLFWGRTAFHILLNLLQYTLPSVYVWHRELPCLPSPQSTLNRSFSLSDKQFVLCSWTGHFSSAV